MKNIENKFLIEIKNCELNLWGEEEQNEHVKECVKIADEFAIGFAEWCIKWRVEYVDDKREGVLYNYGGLYKKLTMNEILEIYKKEKGL